MVTLTGCSIGGGPVEQRVTAASPAAVTLAPSATPLPTATATVTATPTETPTPTPHPLTMQAMRARDYPGSDLVI